MERHSAYKTAGKPTYTTAGKPGELEILKLFAQYDLLPSSFVYHALSRYHGTRKHLTDLARGHYIGFPDLSPEEKLAYIPRNGFYVFQLLPRGGALCALHGIETKTRGNDHFLHMLLRSKVEYLLDRGPLDVVGDERLLSHPNCPPSTRRAPYPFRIPPKPALEPDITRGFGYGGSFLFLHIEIDRGNEPGRSSNNQRQSLKGKVKRYRQYFQDRSWSRHFGFTVAPSVLFFTTRESTTLLKDIIEEEAGEWSKRFFFATIPQKPLPTYDLFAPWQGMNGAFDLQQTMKGIAHGRREESRESKRVA